MTYRGAWQIGELDLVAYRKLDNQCIYQYSSLFATIRRYLRLFVTIRDYSRLFATIRDYSRLFTTIRDYSQYSVIIRVLSPAAVVSYARLPYCIDFLIEHGAKRFFGILDLTKGCLIRLCHDVNDDVAIFTKLSLVFPCGNKSSQANFNSRKQHCFHLQNKYLNLLTLTFFAI